MIGVAGGLYTVASLAQILVTAILAVAFYYRPLHQLSRLQVVMLGTLWLLFLTADFWILGPASFVFPYDEGEVSVPIYIWFANWFQGGRFAHGVVGGNDAHAMYLSAFPYFSFETKAFHVLPSWLASAVLKLWDVGTAIWGAYVLARRSGGADRLTSLAIACTYSVAHRYIVSTGIHYGIGFSGIPLAIYILVGRLERTNYFVPAVLFALVHAVSSAPSHTLLPLSLAVLIAWLVLGCRRPLRWLAGLTLFGAAMLANWHEVLWAMVQVSPSSHRGLEGLKVTTLNQLPTKLAAYFNSRSPEALVLIAMAIGLLTAHRSPRLARSVGALAAALVTGPLLLTVPWQLLGIATLRSYDFLYAVYALPAVLVLVLSWAAADRRATAARGWAALLPVGLLFAVAGGQATWLKVFHSAQWVGVGGHSMYSAIGNLLHRSWAPDHLFRVVSMPYRLNPNAVTSYGVESLDGVLNIFPYERGEYWRDALPHSNRAIATGYNYLTTHDHTDFLCCRIYDLERITSIDRLRLANVEFVISVLPLQSEHIQEVSAPSNRSMPPRRDEPFAKRLIDSARLSLSPGDVYVYRLPPPVPRAFASSEIIVAPAELIGSAYYDFVARHALRGAAVIKPQDAAGFPVSAEIGAGTVTSVTKVVDGYAVRVEMPQDGVLVINTPWTPFWKAYVDSRPAPLVRANGIHVAVAVPPGTGRVELIYERPMLRQRLTQALSGR